MSLWQKLTTRNVGAVDRILRVLPFAAFIYVWTTGALVGVPLIAFGIISVMLLITSVTGMCSIYAMLGLNTCKIKG